MSNIKSLFVLIAFCVVTMCIFGCTTQRISTQKALTNAGSNNAADNPDMMTSKDISEESIMTSGTEIQESNNMEDNDTRTGNMTDKNLTLETATFAGGCFWCMESGLEDQEGVIDVISGYTGGHTVNPTYEEVSSGTTGHYEAVQVTFNPEIISYEELLKSFWILIDPTDPGGQFADRGTQYRTVIFYHDETQKMIAEKSLQEIAKKFDKPIVTEILPAETFYPAEEYHQDYAKKQAASFQRYEKGSGRADFIEENKKRYADYVIPTKDELKKELTPLQYSVTQEEGTEPAFDNLYWDNKKEGIYVDIVSGEPLFSSLDKYDSGTGWPSFTKPLVADNIVEKTDYLIGVPRTEVRSMHANSHLGHVFTDGPAPTGLRYCMNSAALRFIPKEDLEKEGYGEFTGLFG